jgi:hypothetical protein
MLEAKRSCSAAQEQGDVTYRLVLEEERAEVLAEIGGSQLQRAELIQEAAVCVRWIEAIDRSGRDPRVNPRAGDVLQRGDEVATVLDTNAPPDALIEVQIDVLGNAERARALVTLTRWQLAATGARVLAEGLP